MFSVDVSQGLRLASDLAQVGPKAVPALRASMQGVGDAFALAWQGNARETAGKHGRKYPPTITAELAFTVSTVAVDVGPEASGQGMLGRILEFGTVNSPAHLDGLRALDTMQAPAEQVIDSTIGQLF